jgi:hypothetical protein
VADLSPHSYRKAYDLITGPNEEPIFVDPDGKWMEPSAVLELLNRSSGPESEAVKLLRRCHDAGDLVTPLDETLRDDVATFFGGKDG